MAGTTATEKQANGQRREQLKSIHARGGVLLHAPWGGIGESLQTDRGVGHVIYVDWARRVVFMDAHEVLPDSDELGKLEARSSIPVEALQTMVHYVDGVE